MKSLTFTAGQLLDRVALGRLLAKHKPGVLLLWSEAEILPKLVARLRSPGMVFVSSGYLEKKTASLPESVREKVYITFPYRLTPYVGPKTGGLRRQGSHPDQHERPWRAQDRIAEQEHAAAGDPARLEPHLRQPLPRDHLLDVMSLQMDLIVQDYARFSFGPGQRYVSKGGYIIQLGPGEDPPLLPRSEWVMH